MATSKESVNWMQGLFLEGRFSDIKIVCHGVTFDVHRAVVCTQSSFFGGAFPGRFKESVENLIEIQEDGPEIIERVLSFLYLKDYDDLNHIFQFDPPVSSSPGSDESPTASELLLNDPRVVKIRAVNNIQVFVTADKFGILPLKDLALGEVLCVGCSPLGQCPIL